MADDQPSDRPAQPWRDVRGLSGFTVAGLIEALSSLPSHAGLTRYDIGRGADGTHTLTVTVVW